MINFIVGPHSSGKTQFLINEKLKNAAREKSGALLIVPRQITFQTDERLLDALGPVDSCEVEVLSFKRLCDVVLKSVSGISKKPLKEGVNAIFMLETLVSLSDRLKTFNKGINIVLIQQLLSQISFLKTSCVSPAEIRSAKSEGDERLNEKLEDLALIFEAYDARLGNEYYDDNDLLSEIHGILSASSFFTGKIVAFDGFSSYSVQQMRLIALAAKSAKEVIVSFTSENIADRSIASPFLFVNNSARKLISILKKELGNDFEYGIISMKDVNSSFDPFRSHDIKVLEKSIFRIDAGVEAKNDGVTLFKAKSIDDECDYVAREIKKLLRSGECRCRDIAVAFRSFDVYPFRLKNSFKKMGVPFFEDNRQPILNSPLISFVSALVELSIPGRFSTDLIFKLLKSGLTSLETEEISVLENYAFMWSLSGSEFKNIFTKNPKGFSAVSDDSSNAELEKLNEIRMRFAPAIERFVLSVEDVSGIEYCSEIYSFLIENGIDKRLREYSLELQKRGDYFLALEQGEVWDALMEVLDDIASAIGEKIIDRRTFFDIFSLAVQTKTLGRLPSHFDEVTLCSFDRLANYTPKALFSVGCNEGVFPLYSAQSSVFSESERRVLLEKELPFEIVESDMDNVIYEHFLVYLSVSSATDRLFVTCSEMDTKGEKLRNSDIFSMIKRCLVGIDFEKEDLSLQNLVQSESTAFEYYLKNYDVSSDEIKTLEAFFKEKEQYKGRLELIETMKKKAPIQIGDPEIAESLFGTKMHLSASRIEAFEKCPFMYFCRYGIYAKERERAEIDPRNIGNAVHEVLEKLLEAHEKSDFVLENEKMLVDEIQTLLERYLNEKMGGEEDKTSRFLYLYYRVKRILSMTLKRLINEFMLSPFEPVAFEASIGDPALVPALKIPLQNGAVEIIGKIDRVDAVSIDDELFVKIVDYKTNLTKQFRLSEVLQGLNMQMVIYLMAIAECGFKGEKVLPAGVLYTLVSGEAVNDKESVRMFYKGMLEGMLLDDERLSFNDGAEAVFPLKNRFTSEDFLLISEKVKSIVAEMGESLHQGKIPVLPVRDGSNESCDYCPYSSVCAKSEGVSFRTIRKPGFKETLLTLRGETTNA